MNLSLMSTAVSETTMRETNCMTDRLVARGGVRLLVAALTAGIFALAFAAGAQAAPGRTYDSSFGALTNPQALMVDQLSGDVYGVDVGAGTVSRFDTTGAAVNFTCGTCSGNTLTGFAFDGPSAAQVAIAPAGAPGGTAGDIYVVSFAGVSIFANDGTPLGTITQANGVSFGEACGVAVDPAGRLYVGDYSGSVDRYVPSANPAGNADYDAQITGVNAPCNVAADSTGAIYASTYSIGPLTKYLASDFGTSNLGTQIDATSTAVSVDPASDEVYVDEGNQVHVFDATGASRYTFGSSVDFGTDSAGVAVTSGGKAYVADRTNGRIDVFGAFANNPSAITDPATLIHHTNAVLGGHLDPGDDAAVTNCQFDWVDDAQFQIDGFASAATVPCDQDPPFSAPADVTASLGGLTPATTYHFRLDVSTTSSGDFHGADQTFTPAAFPVVRNQLATFGSDGTSTGGFDGSRFGPLAFDQTTRHLFALNGGDFASTIFGFDASAPPSFPRLAGFAPLDVPAAPGDFAGLAVDGTSLPSAGNLYFVSEATNLVYGFDAAGAPRGGPNFPIDPATNPGAPVGSPKDICGAAVDSAGNLWVSNFSTGRVLEYSSAGVFQGSTDTSAQGRPCNIAFDSVDNLYVSNYFGNTNKYTAASGYTTSSLIDSGESHGLAVDPSNDHLYVAHSTDVAEYDSAGALLSQTAAGVTSPPIADADFRGIVVDASNHDVYVADRGTGGIRVFGPAGTLTAPTLTPGDPSALTATSVTLNAKVDPEGIDVTDCHFDYGATSADGQTAPCTPDPGSGSGDVSVSADLSGLEPGTTYHFRIVTANATARGTASGPEQTFTTQGPRVHGAIASQVATTDARLNGQVDPQGKPTTFHFEYGTDRSYGSTTPESGSLGSDSSDHSVARLISGLTPATTYHFRIVATNSNGTAHGADATFVTHASPPVFGACPNDALRTGPGAVLPDCRAYEQASPVDKHGADARFGFQLVQASASGDRITFGGNSGLPTTGGSAKLPVFVASRGTDWTTNGLIPKSDPGYAPTLLGWSDDLSASASFVPSQTGGAILRGDTAARSWQTVLTDPACCTNPRLDAYAADSSHFTFEEPKALVPGAVEGAPNLYDLDQGTLTLAGRVPAFPATTCDDHNGPACVAPAGGSFAGPYAVSGTDANSHPSLATGGASGSYYTENTISADGSRVFFTEGGTGRLYERHNATTTTQISAPEADAAGGSHKPAAFMAATPSGSKVFFTSCERLTGDSTAVSTAANSCTDVNGRGDDVQGSDLYSYDTSTGDLSDLSVDSGNNPLGAAVVGVLGVSADGEDVYFAANGDLDGSGPASPGDCSSRECNIYLSHHGAITFVARIGGDADTGFDTSNWRARPGGAFANQSRSSRVGADGTLLLTSTRQRSTYNNVSAGCGGACAELYRFRPGDSTPSCVSCDPTGTPPTGDALLAQAQPGFTGAPSNFLLTRNVSTDGNRIFFESPDSLLSTDTNGVSDVYEWEANGTGSCQDADIAGGCLYLLSTGASPQPSHLGDVSASGDDAFVFTASPLLPADRDQQVDVYDVRVGGGIGAQHQMPSPACSGNTCQGSPTAPPALIVAASVSFTGPGNAVSPTIPAAAPKVSRPKTVKGTSTQLSIKVPSKGKITLSGSGLKIVHKTATRSATYKLIAALTSKARASLKKKHTLKIKARILFKPSTGASSTATVTLTFKTATTKKKGR